jgi:hypothetical protein
MAETSSDETLKWTCLKSSWLRLTNESSISPFLDMNAALSVSVFKRIEASGRVKCNRFQR